MKDKEAPKLCVCGCQPCTVKYKSKHMVTCPNTLICAMRGEWKKTNEEAVHSWNLAVQRARKEKNHENGK